MDSIINFIINCILSIIDLYLINFYILNYNYRTDENKKYLRFNICNFICFIILVFLNIFSPNYIICIFTKIIVILLQYLYPLENVDFTLFFAIYLLIYSIFTPILSQYFQFGYFFFFLFF